MKRQQVVRCATMTLVAVSLTAAPTALADQGEDYFFQKLRETNQKWFWPLQEGEILRLGYGICDDWAAGVAHHDEVAGIVAARQWTYRNARFFILLSTRALCPQYYLQTIPPEDRPMLPGADGDRPG
jgi:hypothetical protein